MALAAALFAAGVVVLGAWVRLTDAGLGCPDWPGCYGHIAPDAGAQHVGKAWHEMIHRYAVGGLSTFIVSLTIWAVMRRRDRGQPVGVRCCCSWCGGASHAGSVHGYDAARAIGGHRALARRSDDVGLLWFLSLSPRDKRLTPAESSLRGFALVGAVCLVLQIALGGWTSSNYAAVACPDLPTCQGAWWPPTDFRDAFVMWRGLGVNYEGGVLPAAARVAVHLTHRLGAVVAAAPCWLSASPSGFGRGSLAYASAARSW